MVVTLLDDTTLELLRLKFDLATKQIQIRNFEVSVRILAKTQNIITTSWVRAANPLAGQPVDRPRSARPIKKYPNFKKSTILSKSLSLNLNIFLCPGQYWEGLGFFPLLLKDAQKVPQPYKTNGWPMPILVGIHPVVWAPNPNKQTDRQASFI